MGDRIGVLNKGRLEQLGTPVEVYTRPRTLFVARFIGTPAMNTFTVSVVPPSQIRWNDYLVDVPQRLQKSLSAWKEDLVFGVRPEHVYLEGSRWSQGAPPEKSMTATVDIVELGGARFSIVLMGLFQIGEVYIVLLAARRELPGELYELCEMEGVSAFWTFRKVTLPLLIPTFMFLGARDVAWSFQSTFVPSLVITKGGPNFATLFLPLYIYQNGFEYLRFGYASAMTVAMFILTALMVSAQIVVLQLWRNRQRRSAAG